MTGVQKDPRTHLTANIRVLRPLIAHDLGLCAGGYNNVSAQCNTNPKWSCHTK